LTDKFDGFDDFDDDVDLLTLEVSRGPTILAQFFWKLIRPPSEFLLFWWNLTYIGDVWAKFKILVAMVYVVVAGLLLVVGGVVVSDETDIVWSEALFALTCYSSNQ
jgi:hypothetical protein